MKVIITTKTKNPTKKELDRSVDLVLDIGKVVARKLKGFDVCRCKLMDNGTKLILEK